MQLRGRNATAVKENRPYRHRDGVGNLWKVYYDGRLTYTPRGGKETPYGDRKSLEAARFCLSDKQGNLWVAATSCIYKICFPRQNGNVVRNGNGAEVKTVFVDRDKRYWIATKEDETVRISTVATDLWGILRRMAGLWRATLNSAVRYTASLRPETGASGWEASRRDSSA